ncbi:MAG: RNHCP domain-containing protein [Patescibacteria group bacterium]
MTSKKFQRRIENFVCENCGEQVNGDGYTNHCPQCLWSKHVDVNPGDRRAGCMGLMKPIRVEGSTPDYYLIHECVRCVYKSRNIADIMDSEEALLAIVTTVANSK